MSSTVVSGQSFTKARKVSLLDGRWRDLAINHNWLYTHLEAILLISLSRRRHGSLSIRCFFFLLYVTMSPSTVVFYKMRLPALYCRSQWIGSQCAPFEPHRGSWNSRDTRWRSCCAAVDTVQHQARGPDAHRPLASSPPSTSTSFLFARPMSVPCRAADRSYLPWFRSLMVYKFFSPNFQACR
jgi:hypothetical protein